MQKIANLTNKAIDAVRTGSTGVMKRVSNSSTNKLSAKSIEKIFRVFARRFGYKFRPTFEDHKARELWLYDLRKASVTDRIVAIALEQCRDLEWPPSVGEFLQRCKLKPSTIGAPDTEQAFAEAWRAAYANDDRSVDAWSHPCVYAAAVAVGGEVLRFSSSARERFEYSYHMMLRRWCDGESLDAKVLPALSRASSTPVDRERGKRVFSALKDWLKGK